MTTSATFCFFNLTIFEIVHLVKSIVLPMTLFLIVIISFVSLQIWLTFDSIISIDKFKVVFESIAVYHEVF